MARRPEVSLVRENNSAFDMSYVMITIYDKEPPMNILVSPLVAEDIQIQLGGVLNTLKGVHKKLPLRDRLRALRG